MSATGVVEVEVVEPATVSGPGLGATRRRAGRGAALRVAARLGRRELRRRPGRTLLVALLVAVPVASMVVAAVLFRTAPVEPATRWRQSYGAADGMVEGTVPPTLPDGSRLVTFTRSYRVIGTADGQRISTRVTDMPLHDHLTTGIVRIDEGRAPAGPDEVLLSPDVARRFGVGVGDSLALVRPWTVRATVVGIGVETSHVHGSLLARGPGEPLDEWSVCRCTVNLVDLPDGSSSSPVSGLTLAPSSVEPDAHEDATDEVIATYVAGALVLTAAGIVMAAAFTTGARRQLATLGLLAANGAPPRLLRRIVAVQGLLTGAVGTVLGLGIAGTLLTAGRSLVMGVFTQHHDGLTFVPTDLVPIVALALVGSTVAAAVPGRTAGRTPVLRALAGRRPLRRVPSRITGAGVVAIATGCALLVLMALAYRAWGGVVKAWGLLGAAGGMAVLLGMCALTPAIVERIERTAPRLPGEWRLAARSLGRRRSHSAAMVAALCATAALALAASSYVVGRRADTSLAVQVPSDQVRIGALYGQAADWERVAVPESVIAEVLREVPDAEVLWLSRIETAEPGQQITTQADRFEPDGTPPPVDRYSMPDAMFWGRGWATLADDAALSVLELSDEARHGLAESGAVMAGPRAGRAVAEITSPDGSTPSRTFGVAVVPPGRDLQIGTMLITPQRARDLGLRTVPGGVVLRSPRPLDEGTTAALEEIRTRLQADRSREPDHVEVNIVIGDPVPVVSRSVLAEVGVTGGAVLVTVLVIAAGLALAAAETRDERDLLVVAGAGPRTVSRLSARKAVLVVVTATALAIPVGLVPLWVTLRSVDSVYAFAVPWRTLLVLGLVVPIVVGLTTRIGSAVALRRRPVRHSTLATD